MLGTQVKLAEIAYEEDEDSSIFITSRLKAMTVGDQIKDFLLA